MPDPSIARRAAHADWSVRPEKRWACLAERDATGWRAAAPRPVGDPFALAGALLEGGAPAALGLDMPLGLPRAYAAGRSEGGFPEFLRARVGDARFFDVAASLHAVGPHAPFYPARGLRGMTRASHAAALGLAGAAALERWCDRATATRPAGAPPFWTLGANQSGKAAIAAWRDWLAPALAAGAPYALWPFEGDLRALLAPGRLVLAEVYPAEALRLLGLRLGGSKRDPEARRRLGPALLAAMDALSVTPEPGLRDAALNGFGADAAGEDRLDCVLGLLNLLAVLDGAAPDFVPDDPWVRRWEGWVLGQTALPHRL
ncbi:DUF429 domain-containing protein [Sabulicella rubraurantiaca]|uniref:DUF429 domain-containing protein n=1 Tax=Sabulicella rubraurantiaca TaxID=2811429 RepID=UPI001A96F940|nr:DUF429 domain-containing protein [Sabulicella rubraurantiaca]